MVVSKGYIDLGQLFGTKHKKIGLIVMMAFGKGKLRCTIFSSDQIFHIQ